MLNTRPVRPAFLLLERFTRLAYSLHIHICLRIYLHH